MAYGYTNDLRDALLGQDVYGDGTTDVYAADTRRGERGNQPDPDRLHGGARREVRERRRERRQQREVRRREERAARRDEPGGGGGDRRQRAVRQTMANLLSILQSQGRTDPALLNRELTDISRSTEANQSGTEERAAAAGLSGSGVVNAIEAAQAEGGADRRSGAIARENALAEERKRQDLLLTLQLILQPRLTRRGQNLALQAARAGGGGANWLGALGGLAGGASGTDWSKIGQGGTTDPGGGLAGGEAGGGGTGGGGDTYDPGSDPWTGMGTGNYV